MPAGRRAPSRHAALSKASALIHRAAEELTWTTTRSLARSLGWTSTDDSFTPTSGLLCVVVLTSLGVPRRLRSDPDSHTSTPRVATGSLPASHRRTYRRELGKYFTTPSCTTVATARPER